MHSYNFNRATWDHFYPKTTGSSSCGKGPFLLSASRSFALQQRLAQGPCQGEGMERNSLGSGEKGIFFSGVVICLEQDWDWGSFFSGDVHLQSWKMCDAHGKVWMWMFCTLALSSA